MNEKIRERLFADVKFGKFDCWLWQKSKTPKGYGSTKIYGKWKSAHRASYECLIGQIPKGLHIDHICRVRNCINPTHLEAVTPYENFKRGVSIAADSLRKTECKYGHPFNEENTYSDPGRKVRRCRVCIARRTKEWRIRCKST